VIEQPVLETLRLRLCPVERSNASAIQKAAGARKIADTMISIPHPYPAGEAGRYVARQQVEREAGRAVTYTIKQKAEGLFCGLVEVRNIEREHSQGELSFWLTVEVWGRNYMSEVIQAVVQYVFEGLGLNRLYAYHMLRNHVCKRVLEKNGFKQEGLLRQRVRKWGQFEDVALWAILRQEWLGTLDK
jgi:RimJ/RimL family protein N-acetyltransferase